MDRSLVHRSWISRNTYSCDGCGQHVVRCLKCGDGGGARCYLDGADKTCFKCAGYPDDSNLCPLIKGHCSYCLERAPQSLFRARYIKRSEYICTNCRQPTLRCRSCSDGFSCNRSTWAEEFCLVCDPLVSEMIDWSVSKDVLAIKARWCSWCFVESDHVFKFSRGLRRRVYECSSCQQPTLACDNSRPNLGPCLRGMDRSNGGWNNGHCSLCKLEARGIQNCVGWMQVRRRKMFGSDGKVEDVTREVSRWSSYRDLAQDAGVLRPFLLLLSCPAEVKLLISYSLDIILLEEWDGDLSDNHGVAWALISDPKRGLVARCRGLSEFEGSTMTWGTILERVYSRVFPDNPGMDSNSSELEREEAFLCSLLALRDKSDRLVDHGDDVEQVDVADCANLVSRMQLVGGFTDKSVLEYGSKLGAYQAASVTGLGAAAKIQLLHLTYATMGASAVGPLFSVLAVAGPVAAVATIGAFGYQGLQMAFGSSESRLFAPIGHLLHQRINLSLMGIPLAELVEPTSYDHVPL